MPTIAAPDIAADVVFDGHNDVLLRLFRERRALA